MTPKEAAAEYERLSVALVARLRFLAAHVRMGDMHTVRALLAVGYSGDDERGWDCHYISFDDLVQGSDGRAADIGHMLDRMDALQALMLE